ncbi:hypothetical protein LTR08_006133 [Meristemomyces frigidus]|nr:hypothetical protein LTR08_006133 [Meristemomyces frigidus]
MDSGNTTPTSPPPHSNYLSKVAELAKREGGQWPCREPVEQPKFLYKNHLHNTTYTNQPAMHLMAALDTRNPGVLLIQNITPEWIERLGTAFSIDPAFFVGDADIPSQERPWGAHFEHAWDRHHSSASETRDFYNLTGMLEFHDVGINHDVGENRETAEWAEWCMEQGRNYFPRRVYINPDTQSSEVITRISYARISDRLYAPPAGLLPYDLYEGIESFLMHRSHLWVFFSQEGALQVQPFLYLLSSSLWQTNLNRLHDEIKHVSFEEIRMPSMKTNEHLHDLRQLLASLREGVQETNTYMPTTLSDFYDHVPDIGYGGVGYLSPAREHLCILEDAAKLETLLMETFQLLMSSLSIRDSQTSIQQSRRGTVLTVLAFIYVPLSFITGIFGMNIEEVNGSPLKVWVCFVALGVVIGTTALGYAIYWTARHRSNCIHILMRFRRAVNITGWIRNAKRKAQAVRKRRRVASIEMV